MGIISISEAIDLLRQGEPIALPTETVYGLAATIDNSSAIEKIFEIKQRPLNDPLIVHVSGLRMAASLVKIVSSDFIKLADRFWPGPITLVSEKDPKAVSDLITSGQNTVAIRIPRSEFFLEAIEMTGPLAAPSANLFKKVSPSKAEHVLETLPGVPVVNGGPCEVGIESTIFNVDTLEILRPGMISMSEISDTLGKTISYNNTTNTPGFEKDHYQPKTEVIVYKDSDKLLSFLKGKSHNPLDLHSDPELTAHLLYDKLRSLDTTADFITIQWSDDFEKETWQGIKNRVEKASSYWIG